MQASIYYIKTIFKYLFDKKLFNLLGISVILIQWRNQEGEGYWG